jgi:hypothetical protein
MKEHPYLVCNFMLLCTNDNGRGRVAGDRRVDSAG